MSIRAKFYLAGFAVIMLSLPVWARTLSTDVTVDHTTTISGTQLKPGDYSLKVADKATQLTVEKDGMVVAKVPCHWIELTNKPDSTTIQSAGDQITEIDFRGQTAAVQLP
jgi:hypothetical protein